MLSSYNKPTLIEFAKDDDETQMNILIAALIGNNYCEDKPTYIYFAINFETKTIYNVLTTHIKIDLNNNVNNITKVYLKQLEYMSIKYNHYVKNMKPIYDIIHSLSLNNLISIDLITRNFYNETNYWCELQHLKSISNEQCLHNITTSVIISSLSNCVYEYYNHHNIFMFIYKGILITTGFNGLLKILSYDKQMLQTTIALEKIEEYQRDINKLKQEHTEEINKLKQHITELESQVEFKDKAQRMYEEGYNKLNQEIEKLKQEIEQLKLKNSIQYTTFITYKKAVNMYAEQHPELNLEQNLNTLFKQCKEQL